MKYVILENSMGLITPVVFDESITHATIGEAVAKDNGSKILSAGEVHKKGGKWKASGDSVSLKIKSRPYTDSRILQKFLSRGVSGLQAQNEDALEMLDKLKQELNP